jgi:hypothetical protein
VALLAFAFDRTHSLGRVGAAGLGRLGRDGGGNDRSPSPKSGREDWEAGASAAVAAVQERMLASFDSEQRRRLYANLAACADALS